MLDSFPFSVLVSTCLVIGCKCFVEAIKRESVIRKSNNIRRGSAIPHGTTPWVVRGYKLAGIVIICLSWFLACYVAMGDE